MHDDVDHAWLTFNLHTKILSLYLQHNQLFGPDPLVKIIKEIPTYLEGRCFTQGGEYSSTLVPCLVATAHPLLSNPPSPPSHPVGPHYVTMTTSTITAFFARNSSCLLLVP
jgi:hypothetical protein